MITQGISPYASKTVMVRRKWSVNVMPLSTEHSLAAANKHALPPRNLKPRTTTSLSQMNLIYSQ